MPAWDIPEGEWTTKPPTLPVAIAGELTNFAAKLIADVLAGQTAGYDLTFINQSTLLKPKESMLHQDAALQDVI